VNRKVVVFNHPLAVCHSRVSFGTIENFLIDPGSNL
jgi:hypothetical protein